MKVISFSKYLAYMVGGAEKSTLEILKKESLHSQIQIISFDGVMGFGAKSKKVEFPGSWSVEFIKKVKLFNRFPFWEYFINRKIVKKYFEDINATDSILYTYALYAPIAINSFSGNSKLFIRSESDLAINRNYMRGFKKYLKYIYMAIEYPAYCVYKSDLKKAIAKADVICNSKYMADKLKELHQKKCKVVYPFVDTVRLKQEYDIVKDEVKDRGIVFVGDAVIKGIETVKELSLIMPNEKFYIFSRYVKEPTKEQNIIWMPWQKREVDIYKYANCVIVPSICEEAYGRVSREAYELDIKVLVSNIGGLPESLDYKKECIVDDYKNIEGWRERLEKIC